jgi:threonine dehydrogenase-like Zn-dependent dehydrogenase
LYAHTHRLEQSLSNNSLPSVSRAAVLHAFDRVSVEDVPMPSHIEPGALLVKVERASVCGTDVHHWEGSLALWPDFPVILGHEMVGRIVDFGDGPHVDSYGAALELGDRVVWTHASCGHCYYCVDAREPVFCDSRRLYMYESMRSDPHLLGGFTQFSYVLPASERVRVPDAVSSDLASMASCAFRSVIHAFDIAGRLLPNSVVVIQGTGALGLLGVHMARQAGVREVIAFGDPAERLSLARTLGADHVVSVTETERSDRLELVRSLTEGRGADVVFEFSGSVHAVPEGLNLLRKAGRYILVGQVGPQDVALVPSLITIRGLQVLGSSSGSIEHYKRALDELAKADSSAALSGILGRTYSLDQVEDALLAVRSQDQIKPLIDPWL